MLELIPIYRMALCPETFLPNSNPIKAVIDLVCELPNSQNKYRKTELSILPREKHKSYYLAELLIESKIFTRHMLMNVKADMDQYQNILLKNDLHDIFQVIHNHKTTFFKCLIWRDLSDNNLFRGRMETEISNAKSVEEIKISLRKHVVSQKLFQKLSDDYQKLKNIYC